MTTKRKPALPAGAVQVRPGVYIHGADIHVDVPEVLAHLKLPDTPENREAAAEEAAEMYGETFPDKRIVVR